MPMNEYFWYSAPLAGKSGHEAGRILLKKSYEALTGLPLPGIKTGERGKPDFSEGPWHFSISHTPRHVFCALCKAPIGIDAEEEDRRVSEKLPEKVLSPSEYSRYLASSDRRTALLTFWVLKEASVKFTGEGLRGYPCHTDFRLDDPRVFHRDHCLVAIITE